MLISDFGANLHQTLSSQPEKISDISASELRRNGVGLTPMTDAENVAQPNSRDLMGWDIVDCTGLCLAPALVDMRAYLSGDNERHKETLETACNSAVAGGIGTVVASSDSNPIIDNTAVLDTFLRRGREIGTVSLLSYAAITKNIEGEHLTDMGTLYSSGCVGFMDGQRAIQNPRVLLNAMKYAKFFNGLVLHHPADALLAGSGVMNQGLTATKLGLGGIPPIAESMMVERDIALAEASGARLHLCHLSTAKSFNAVRRAKKRGVKVTCDTAPHYFALTEEAVLGYRTFAKVNPPLRSETDRLAVIAALQDGTIDAIVSDHCPQDQDSKRVPFAQAANGAVGFETLFAVTLGLVHQQKLSLLEALKPLTCAPADILRLKVGRIARRHAADLILFDPNHVWTLDPAHLKSKSKNTLFGEHTFKGRVLATIKAGKKVYSVGE